MAHQDKDQLTGPGDGALSDPATAAAGEPPASANGAPVPGDEQDTEARSERGDGLSTSGEDSPATGGPGEPQVPVDPSRRPAGFAADYLPPDYSARRDDQYSERGSEDDASPWTSAGPSQSSPYAPYGDYEPPAYEGYGYGGDQDYGQQAGYAPDYGPAEGYGYAPGYGDPYGTAQPYGDAPAYGYAGEHYGYGEGAGSGPGYGPDYGGYPPGPGYGEAGGYPTDPSYGTGQPGQLYGAAQPYGAGESYGAAAPYAEGGYGPAPEYPGAAATGTAPGTDQAPGQTPQPAGDEAGAGGEPYRPQARGPASAEASRRAYSVPPGSEDAARTSAAPPRRPEPGRIRGRGPRYQELGAQAAGAQRGGPQPIGEVLAPLPAHGQDQHIAETADDLTVEALLPGKGRLPGTGWRRLVYRSTGGLVRPRESAETLRRRELINRVRTPVAGGHHRVAVMSLKGGVGKTTTTVGLGSMLASLRGDRIIALDANPDRGTLSDKVRLETSATVRDLLNERGQVRRYADVRAFTSQAPSRLEVLASDRDPAVSVAFCEEDYYDAAQVLEHYYSISLTDCGTGLLHSAMAGVLRLADQIILVSSPSVDGARSASATLDWLEAHEYGDLVRNAVVVLSMIRPRSKSSVDLDRLEHHFAGRCRAVARIPYDAHLEEGAEVDLELMSPAAIDAYLVLAATVGDGFAWPRRMGRQMGLGRPQARPSHRRYG